MLKEKDGYYIIDSLGDIQFRENKSVTEHFERDVLRRKSIGNYFETKEEAELRLEEIKANNLLNVISGELEKNYWEIDFIEGVVKFSRKSSGFSVQIEDGYIYFNSLKPLSLLGLSLKTLELMINFTREFNND